MRHGTSAQAQAHYRAGEKPCRDCRIALNEYKRIRASRVAVPTSVRVYDFVFLDGPVSLVQILNNVSGMRETVRRTVYRLVDRGELYCDASTRRYTVGEGG